MTPLHVQRQPTTTCQVQVYCANESNDSADTKARGVTPSHTQLDGSGVKNALNPRRAPFTCAAAAAAARSAL